MKRIVWLAVFAGGLSLAGALLWERSLNAAAASATPKIPRIGVIYIQQIFKDYQYAQETRKLLESRFKKDQEEIKALMKQIRDKKRDLRNNPLGNRDNIDFKLAAWEIKKMEIQWEERMRKFKRDNFKATADFYRDVYADFRKAVNRLGDYNKYDLIITAPNVELSEELQKINSPEALKSEILVRRVQYTSKNMDITSFVVQLMNRNYNERKKKAGTINVP